MLVKCAITWYREALSNNYWICNLIITTKLPFIGLVLIYIPTSNIWMLVSPQSRQQGVLSNIQNFLVSYKEKLLAQCSFICFLLT